MAIKHFCDGCSSEIPARPNLPRDGNFLELDARRGTRQTRISGELCLECVDKTAEALARVLPAASDALKKWRSDVAESERASPWSAAGEVQ